VALVDVVSACACAAGCLELAGIENKLLAPVVVSVSACARAAGCLELAGIENRLPASAAGGPVSTRRLISSIGKMHVEMRAAANHLVPTKLYTGPSCAEYPSKSCS
jgi:hypothetical protein